MLLDVLARLAVAIVIDRATSIVGVVLVLLGQDELVAETSEGEVRLVAGDVGAQRDLAVRVYRPDHLRDEVEVLLTEGTTGVLGDLVAT